MDATPPGTRPVPPPLAAVPVFSRQDADHLRALSIAHYVFGGLIALLSLFFILYIVLGISALSGHLPMNSGASLVAGRTAPVRLGVHGAGDRVRRRWPGHGRIRHPGRTLPGPASSPPAVPDRGRPALPVRAAGHRSGVFTLVTLLRPQVKAAFDAATT